MVNTPAFLASAAITVTVQVGVQVWARISGSSYVFFLNIVDEGVLRVLLFHPVLHRLTVSASDIHLT